MKTEVLGPVETSLLVIADRNGKRLLEIPYQGANLSGEELYEVIANQVRRNDAETNRGQMVKA